MDDWILQRPEGLRSNLLFTDHLRPVGSSPKVVDMLILDLLDPGEARTRRWR
jgi:hypothetical protein